MQSLILHLNNVAGAGDYCVEMDIGSPAKKVHLLVDTGSSTLVVNNNQYCAQNDAALQATSLIQHLQYGAGDWTGPVIKTKIKMGKLGHHLHLDAANLALAETCEQQAFMHADGIFGLAYDSLNIAHDMGSEQVTYPWSPKWSELAKEKDFVKTVRHQPQQHVTPLFSQCAEKGLLPDEFAFVVHRSSVFHSQAKEPANKLIHHPLNRGLLVLGNPQLHTHLHHPEYQTVPLYCDKYYNVELVGVRVGDNDEISPPPFTPKQGPGSNSNAFVDSGASAMVMPANLFHEVINQLKQSVPPEQAFLLDDFIEFKGHEVGITLDDLKLDAWPDIQFLLKGKADNKAILTLSPHSYWQTHAPASNQASFKILTLPGWPNQTILGLPLMCEYYTIFDRKAGAAGEMRFANKKIAPHKLSDALHNDWQAIKQACSQLGLHNDD